jgi:hypothetical protein
MRILRNSPTRNWCNTSHRRGRVQPSWVSARSACRRPKDQPATVPAPKATTWDGSGERRPMRSRCARDVALGASGELSRHVLRTSHVAVAPSSQLVRCAVGVVVRSVAPGGGNEHRLGELLTGSRRPPRRHHPRGAPGPGRGCEHAPDVANRRAVTRLVGHVACESDDAPGPTWSLHGSPHGVSLVGPSRLRET